MRAARVLRSAAARTDHSGSKTLEQVRGHAARFLRHKNPQKHVHQEAQPLRKTVTNKMRHAQCGDVLMFSSPPHTPPRISAWSARR